MVILPALIGMAVLVLVLFGVFLILKARGSSLVERRFPRRIQIAISAVTTLALVALWIIFDLSPAILPALIFIQWVPLLSRREPRSPHTRLILIGVVSLTVLLVLGTIVFWLTRN